MRERGFEPPKALSQQILSLSRLTTSLPPHKKLRDNKVYKLSF